MARLPQPGADDGIWGGILNDFLTTSHNPDGTVKDDSIKGSMLASDVHATLNAKADASALASVAYSGSYNDLTDTPALQTVGVTSVNSQTGAVSLSATDVGAATATHTHTSTEVTDFNSAASAVVRGSLVAGENIALEYNAIAGTTTVSAAIEGVPGPQGETGEPGPAGPYAPYSLPVYILETNQTVSDVPSDFPEGGLVFKKTN